MSESGESATERRGLSEGRRLGWLAALFAAYALITGLLVRFKLIANGELAGGRKYYSAPFTQVMCTIDWAGAVVGLCALVIASLLPPQRRIDDLVAWLGRRVWLVALVVIAVCALLSLTVHQAYPLTADEFAPYFQSQVFARGRIVGQWPPALVHRLAAEETRKDFLVASRVTGQICSGYWPGHAMLMTPFTAFGMPWLYNPLLAGLAILLIAAVARRSFGEPAVGWAVLFTIASPVFAAYGISFYAMMSHLVLNLLFVLLLSNPTVARVAAAGLVGGCALVLHNPFPHAAFALPWLIWLTVRSDRWTRLPVIAICYAAVFLPIDAGWRSVEEAIGGDRPIGIAAAPADQAPQAAGETTGVAPAAPPSPPASGIDVVGNTMRAIRGYLSVLEIRSLADIVKLRLLSLMRLVAWDAPGLVLIAALGFWRCRRLTAARLLACSALTTFLGYGLIAMSGGHGWATDIVSRAGAACRCWPPASRQAGRELTGHPLMGYERTACRPARSRCRSIFFASSVWRRPWRWPSDCPCGSGRFTVLSQTTSRNSPRNPPRSR